MGQVEFRFYNGLNKFLAKNVRNSSFQHNFRGKVSVKDAIESLGVPHTEVEVILVNQSPQLFSYYLHDKDYISVYPTFNQLDINEDMKVCPPLPDKIRFVADIHLGKLTHHLRMLGFDTLYRNDYEDPVLARISSTENRILLTRDVGLLKRSEVVYGYFVCNIYSLKQIKEVLHRFHLARRTEAFSRCIRCNHCLDTIDKELINNRLPTKVKAKYDLFFICQVCDKIYWQGSHYQKMKNLVTELTKLENA